MKTIGFIGAGNMAGAIINGILSKQIIDSRDIYLYDVDASKYEAFSSCQLHCCKDTVQLMSACDSVVFAVKPQQMADVLSGCADNVRENQIYISIAAGISAGFIESFLGEGKKIILVMPNTPMLLGAGSSAMSYSESVTKSEFLEMKRVFESAGIVQEVAADQMSITIPIHSSSPAMLYLLAKIVVEFSEKKGIPQETAKELFCNTLIGSARMMLDSGKSFDELIRMVSSPGGTTLKMLDALETDEFRETIENAMQKCIDRAYELSK